MAARLVLQPTAVGAVQRVLVGGQTAGRAARLPARLGSSKLQRGSFWEARTRSGVCLAAAEEDVVAPAEAVVAEEPAEEVATEAGAEVVAAVTEEAAPSAKPDVSSLKLNVLWQEEFCGVAVDQLVITERERGVYRTPVTEYYMWPMVDAWEEVKTALEAKPWVTEAQKIVLLNSLTDIVNFWQELHSKAEAQEKFEDTVTFEA